MMKYYWIFLFLSFSLKAEVSAEKRIGNLISVTKKELRLAQSLLKKRGGRDPRLNYRIIEIKSELLKLTRSLENERYLKLSDRVRSSTNKSQYFKQSEKQYYQLKNEALRVIKGSKSLPNLDALYLTLGSNAVGFSDNRSAVIFLKKAIGLSKQGSEVNRLARGTLGDYFYNKKQYQQAHDVYEKLLLSKSYSWWPKYALNQAWCKLKLKKHDEALNLIKQSIYVSKREGYEDFSEQALGHSHAFFVFAEKISDGVDFLKKWSKGNSDYLMKLAKLSISKGYFKQSQRAFVAALQEAQGRVSEQIILKNEMLGLYKENRRAKDFMNLSRDLYHDFKQKRLNKDEREDFVDTLKGFLNILQENFGKKAYEPQNKSLRNRNILSLRILKILSVVDVSNKHKYLFAIGEIYFYINEPLKSLKNYYFSYKNIEEKNVPEKKKFIQDLLTSMLAAVGKVTFSNQTSKYFIFVYTKYIETFGRDDNSQIVFPKLFNIHYKAADYKKSEHVLALYHKNFPQDVDIQKEMISRLMNSYQKDKNLAMYSQWTSRIQKGEFNFDTSYIKSARSILGKLLFHDTNKLLAEGRKEEAIQKFQSYFSNADFSYDVRKKSAFNAALLLVEMKNYNSATQWALNWFNFISSQERERERDSVGQILNQVYLKDEWLAAAQMATTFYLSPHICQSKWKLKGELYTNGVQFFFADKKYKESIQVFEYHSKCLLSQGDIMRVAKSVLSHLVSSTQFELFYMFEKVMSKYEFLSEDILLAEYQLANNLRSAGQVELETKVWNNLKLKMSSIKKQSPVLITIKSHFLASQFINSEEGQDFQKLAFPPEVFQQRVQSNLAILKKRKQGVEQLLGKANVKDSLKLLSFLEQNYSLLANKISQFNPQIQDKNLLEGFKKGVNQLVRTLVSQRSIIQKQMSNLLKNERSWGVDVTPYLYKTKWGLIPIYTPRSSSSFISREEILK